MNYLDRRREIYDFVVRSFNALTELGFSKQRPRYVCRDIDEIEYVSENFIFIISLGRGEICQEFKDAKTRNRLIYPTTALRFFLPNYESEREEIAKSISEKNAEKKATLVEINLYKRYPWVLMSPEWVTHPDFVLAVNKADEWLLAQESWLDAYEDYGKVLLSFKNKNYTLSDGMLLGEKTNKDGRSPRYPDTLPVDGEGLGGKAPSWLARLSGAVRKWRGG